MKLGISIPTSADSWKLAARAEALGFHSVWFYDTQLLNADVFVAMGAAAVKTERIRLGTGVLIPTNRIAPVTANALASLNKLAPGRIDFGVGTGYTGRRTMGQRAMSRAAFKDYLAVVAAMLAGETVEWQGEDGPHKVRFLNPDLGFINLADPIALHVSAMGPRMRALTAELKAHWCAYAFNPKAAARDVTAMRQAWADAGVDPAAMQATAFTVGCVLRDGEDAGSPRAIAQAAPGAMVLYHTLADDAAAEVVDKLPAALQEPARAYIDMARGYQPADARYLSIHRGHMMIVRPEEQPFATADLIRHRTMTGTPDQLREQMAALAAAGFTQLVVQITPGQEDAVDDWAQLLAA
jgi:5,10-methylenetetrahydromethanopterin reductase